MLDAAFVPQRRLSPLEAQFKESFTPPPLYMWRLLQKRWHTGEPELRMLAGLAARDRIAIDVGAGKGVHTHYLSWCCAHVHAFEPNPGIHRILGRALPPNASAYAVALGDSGTISGELIVPMHGSVFSNGGASLNPRKKAKRHSTLAVACRTLDSFGFRDVGLVRIDVEGCERAVLAGACATIARERPVLVAELKENRTGEPIEASLAAFAGFGMEGAFLRDGTLRPLAEFDPDADHRRRLRQPGCVTTFVFRPV